MNWRAIITRLLLCTLWSGVVDAAGLTNEAFTFGANGWQGSLTLGNGSWSYTGGAVRITFNDTTPISIPDTGTLSNLPGATSGSFTGDYLEAGINLIRFRFYAPTELPSGVTLLWGGLSNIYFRQFTISQTGVWYNLDASLASPGRGEWNALQGSLTNFNTVLQNVKFVAIRVARSGVQKQQFVIDDVSITRQPVASAVSYGENLGAIVWADLITDVHYQVEATTNLIEPAWDMIESFTATSIVHQISHPETMNAIFYRMVMP